MCVMSMVFDHYRDRFPNSWPAPNSQPWVWPQPAPQPVKEGPVISRAEIAELRKLIREFREAVAAAKTVDDLTNQPDCEDPEKAKLVERVDELERRLNAIGEAASA